MPYTRDLGTPYHQQDTDYYCGSACAQMVLDAVGAGLIDQATLYTDTHDRTSWDQNLYDADGRKIEWATNPDGLEWTLNFYDTTPGRVYCTYPEDWNGLNTEDAASRKIAWTIHHYQVPPCALVMHAAHWIVVRGMELSAAPGSSTDVSYTIDSFRINDPWPPVPSSSFWANPAAPPPPPHSATDGCGGGGNRGVADEVINYSTWQATYMTAAKYHQNGHWQGRFVAVCDPDPAPQRRGPRAARVRPFKGNTILAGSELPRLVSQALERRVLPEDKRWTEAMRNAKAANPILVQRLDRQDEQYYIVPMAVARGASVAMSFDARFGEFQQAIAFPQPEPTLLRIPTNEEVHKRIAGTRFELDRSAGYLQIRPELLNILNHWFWKPCVESLSPFWPFKMAFSGGNIVYVRIDGQVFTELHTTPLGI